MKKDIKSEMVFYYRRMMKQLIQICVLEIKLD